MRKVTFVTLIGAAPHAVYAHGAAQETATPNWTFDPWIVGPIITFGLMYGVGALMLAAKGHNRKWQDVVCATGWLTLAGALMSPLHWLGERLLSFHMIEHEILMAVAAPLLVLARPVGPVLWSLPRRMRLTIGPWRDW